MEPPRPVGRPSDMARPADTTRPAAASATPAATAGRASESGRMETGRAMESIRPLQAGRSAEGRAPDRSRTPEGRASNGSPPRRTAEVHHEVDFTVPGDAGTRRNGTSYGWLWALPLAALAGLGLYYLGGDRGDRMVTASRDVVQPVRGTGVAAVDLKEPTLNALQSLTTAMQGVKDAASAATAMPRIQEASRDMERLAMQASLLPANARTALADATREQMARLSTAIDGAAGMPGVGAQLQQAAATLRGRMDAIAMVPGKPLFLAAAPADWALISSVQNRDVLSPGGERLGTATGFFVGPDGKLVASLVSVDRQLGIGDRQIGLPFAGGRLERKADGWHLVIDTSKDDLQRAKAFETGK